MPYKDPTSEAAKASAKRRHDRYIEKHGGYKAVTQDYASRHPDALRNSYYKHEYGTTVAEFEAQIAAQNNLCPIGNHPFGERGKKADSPCQDHDHETGENRAILCRNHNVMLGLANDSPEILEIAISYLKQYPKGEKKDE
jgi:Recombination endonuclease VII